MMGIRKTETKKNGEWIMKNAVTHAIKTDHFPEATRILAMCWKRACKGLHDMCFHGIASEREICMMRGWSVNHSGFSFTTTHDLCDASFTKGGLEKMVRQWYQWEHERRIEEDEDFERKHPEFASIPRAGKPIKEMTLDEWIFKFCCW